MPSSENRPVVGALDKGLIILDALMENEALGVTELAQRLGVNKSSACRLLRTLEARGFVAQDAPMGKYRLSGRIALRRPEALDNETLRALSAPYLRKLTDMTGESSALAVMSGNEGLLIANCMSSQLITASLSLGMAEPLYCTALGKVLLSVQSQVEQERLIRTISYVPRTSKTLANEADFRADLRRAVELGVGLDDEEYGSGMRCAAAPIVARGGRVVAAVGISGPVSRVHPESLPEIIRAVKHIADEIVRAIDG